MNKFITIKTFNHPHELAIIRAHLESEGIECFVENELMTQINPFYSNAIGGAKLQVRENDVEKALVVFKKNGYDDEANYIAPPTIVSKLNTITSRIPLIKELRLELRLMIIVALILSVLVTLIYFITLKKPAEKLTNMNWCVDKIIYNGKIFQSNSNERIKFTGPGICNENIYFGGFDKLILPGFESRKAMAEWKINDYSIQIMEADTFDFVWNGIYTISFSGNGFVMKSKSTSIYCHKEEFDFPFPTPVRRPGF